MSVEATKNRPAGFAHLSLHTEYSLSDSVVRIGPLMERLAAMNMPAVALTDQCNLFAMVKFYRAAYRCGIKPIIGVDAWVYRDRRAGRSPTRLLLLCQNNKGYRNLTRLISKAYLEGQQGGNGPAIDLDWLAEANEGLIALSGGQFGEIGQALVDEHPEQAENYLADWLKIFPDRFYLEVQRTGREKDEDYLHTAVALAAAWSIPIVATNDVRFLTSEEYEAHEARVCIHSGKILSDPHRIRRYSPQQYLRSTEEMYALFEDLPEALENSLEIARRCTVELNLGKLILPQFPVPGNLSTEDYLRQQACDGLEERLQIRFDQQAEDYTNLSTPYRERLERELNVIIQMGFPGYFLIVADFIQWAKSNSVPVGPGRGSGAGSLVAYALKITDLDPIRYDLLFERFLNPERVSMPDFDVDFCMDGRDRVIEYVAKRYGRDHVSQIITYGSMAAKAVVRDVGRVLGYPYGFVDRIAKLIPFELGITLDKALAREEDLRRSYDEDEDVATLIDLARSLEGLSRNAGKHAGGVVIAPTPLTDFTPLYCEESSNSLVTQFDKDDIEAIGLVKFDFLGLRTLTIIDWAVRTINQGKSATDEWLDINRLLLDDRLTYDLLKRHQTTAVFQLESSGMQELIKRLQPDYFEDIVALVALYRPGPLQSGMVDDFINRKHGRSRVEYLHPALEPILKPTYGVILYQEQVMQIAQVLAGYSLGGADLLRRAMGKKKPEEMAKQRTIFMRGAIEHDVNEKTAGSIFDLMEKFAGYGFNKSHSAAYALISYQTAWLKAHYPAAFMAAVLSADMDNTDKVVNLIEECRQLSLQVLPPNINRSNYRFRTVDGGSILYGLGAIKGAGESAIGALIDERGKNGLFSDMDDLCRRLMSQKVNKRVLETLIYAGALDSIGPNRATLTEWLPGAIKAAEQHRQNSDLGQTDLFVEPSDTPQPPSREVLPEWSETPLLKAEKETLGLYLTGHPIDQYWPEIRSMITAPLDHWLGEDPAGKRQVHDSPNERIIMIAGLVADLSVRHGSSGKFAFITLDDRTARLDVGIFGKEYATYSDLLIKDHLIIVEAGVGRDAFNGRKRIRAKRIFSLDQARGEFARYVEIRINTHFDNIENLKKMYKVLKSGHNKGCPLLIHYRNHDVEASLRFGEDWRILPCEDLLRKLQQWWGRGCVTIHYGNHPMLSTDIH